MNFLQKLIKILILLQCCRQRQVSTTYCKCQTHRRHIELIERSMNLNAPPCNDFYNYACGKWNEVYAGAGIKFLEPLTMIDYKVNMEMSGILERLSITHEPIFLQNVQKYYKSCKNLSNYASSRYFQFLKFNDELKGSTDKKNSLNDVFKTLAKMRTYGLNDIFIQLSFVPKINNVNRIVIDLDKPVLNGGFKPLTWTNLKLIMESLPEAIPTEDLDNLWLEIKEFELKVKALDEIEDISVENEEDYEKLRNIKYKDLPLDWLKIYVENILNQTNIKPGMELYIQNKPYMLLLDQLLRQYDQRVLDDYLKLRFLWHLHLHRPINFERDGCISNCRSLMPMAMDWLYERHHPDLLDEYVTIYQMFNELRKAFGKTIQKNIHGFNSSIVQYLLSKLGTMKLKLNNIPRVNTVATLRKFYQKLNLNENNFYENHLKLLNFNFNAQRILLYQKNNIFNFNYLQDFNAGASSSPHFVENVNTIYVPLTVLQAPIYHSRLDDIFKYSSLGFILAHEIFHGFDDRGLLRSANGTLSFIKFEENPLLNASLNCMMQMNPVALSEKIADVSGLRYAYQAYFDSHPRALRSTMALHRKHVPMTKLFFLNFAQLFCGDITPEQIVSATYHGSDRERVIDALKNFPEFAKTYQCTSEDIFYSHETCHLWRR